MKYNTCVSIGEKNPKKLKIILKKALSKSNFAEIRFDYLKKSDIPIVLENSKKKSIKMCVHITTKIRRRAIYWTRR